MRKLLVRAAAVLALASGVAWAEATFVKADKAPDEVNAALEEFLGVLPSGVTCNDPDAWTVNGGLQDAAQMLLGELDGRHWDVLQTGQLEQSYVLIADPDPSDENAVALGGVLASKAEGSSYVYLARCQMTAAPDSTPSATAGYY